jgi:hypothetical protein
MFEVCGGVLMQGEFAVEFGVVEVLESGNVMRQMRGRFFREWFGVDRIRGWGSRLALVGRWLSPVEFRRHIDR